MVDKLKWYIFKITITVAANYRILQNLAPNKRWDIVIWQNDEIDVLSNLNIHESIWNKRKW